MPLRLQELFLPESSKRNASPVFPLALHRLPAPIRSSHLSQHWWTTFTFNRDCRSPTLNYLGMMLLAKGGGTVKQSINQLQCKYLDKGRADFASPFPLASQS